MLNSKKSRLIQKPLFYHYALSFKQVITIGLLVIFYTCVLLNEDIAFASDTHSYISFKKDGAIFILTESGTAAPFYVSSHDFPGVIRALKQLQADVNRVSGAKPLLSIDTVPEAKQIVIIGTIDKSPLIDQLVREGKIEGEALSGKWESFLIRIIENPFPNIDRALIICGSDKRGTIFGLYDISAKIGVSPWYWWADVPVRKESNIYITQQQYLQKEPVVKYRGIFINDEAPALSGWAYEKFGGFNHKFYEHVFELILRLKGNFLWPAMWGRAFYVDDPVNPELADEYGVVIGTSHHEPMMRAHDEWARFGNGPWNYEENEEVLQEFWREGIQRMGNKESIITLAMRGDGDEPMSEEANIALLQKIVRDQRKIISDVTGKEITTVPQVWALYKEVQEYYDKGMRVPEDITLLLCDDNWGNIRKLPKLDEKPRAGGYGIYYHFDYVGGPRNYKWLNTNQISRIWEQMHLAYRYGATRIWIVNVGDIKPMEFPTEFFLTYAWDPETWPAEKLPEYTRQWAARQFGTEFASDIADIITKYTQYNSRRKPELLSPDTYSLINYREGETVVDDYLKLLDSANKINISLPAEYHDAFYQLVLHPVMACSNLNELYVTVGKNRLFAMQGRIATNDLAERAQVLFEKDAEITNYYNKKLADGKWSHMMDQTHIGYTYWQQPEENTMPEVESIDLLSEAQMGIAIEGSDSCWPDDSTEAILPCFDPFNDQTYYIDIFNHGEESFDFQITPGKSWLKISDLKGKIDSEKRIWISVNWHEAPQGEYLTPITIAGTENDVIVKIPVHNPGVAKDELQGCFIEANNYISIEAEHYSRNVKSDQASWDCIPDLGRTLSAMTPFPVTATAQIPGDDSPRLEYDIYFFSKGEIQVKAILSPTLNFHNTEGLRYGISFDDQPVQIINIHAGRTFQDWEESVRNNATVTVSSHTIDSPGKHVLKFWVVDPAVDLQKLIIETADIPSSYLGPPESARLSN